MIPDDRSAGSRLDPGAPLDPGAALVGVDGLEVEGPVLPRPGRRARSLRLADQARERIRTEVERAGGREVCFLAEVDAEGWVVNPRAVARGNHTAVLAVARDAPEGALMIHNHPSGVLDPSDADLAVAAQVHEQGLGTAITDNGANQLYVVVEPPEPRVRVPLDLDELERLVAPDGPLARRHPAYEDRAGQRRMIVGVGRRYNEPGVLLAEAGTGTGKSLAYLLPAARWAVENGERTVISTNTINLQEQLVGKDLPLVREVVGDELSWAMVKGRGNYVSIRRLHLAAQGAGDLFEDDRTGELNDLLAWVRSTDDGSLSDLPVPPSDEVWEEVRSDPDACLRARCPHFQACFYQRSRRAAASARILVVNHHLLFTDLAVRRATRNWTQAAVLPPYKRLVLDEAHNVEDAATSHLGVELTRRGLYRILTRLDRRGKGILSALADDLTATEGRGVEHRTRIEETVRPGVEDVRTRLGLFLDALSGVLPPTGEGEALRIGDGRPHTLPEPLDHPAVEAQLRGLLADLQRLAQNLATLRRRIEDDEVAGPAVEGRLLDIRGVERRIGAAEVGLRLVLDPGEERDRYVRWVEVRGRGRRRNLVLAAAPIDLGPLVRESLFDKVETAVLTSATLATRKGFGFLRDRLGLDPAGLEDLERPPEVDEAVLPSPFDYARQSVLAVPTDLPDPRASPDGLNQSTARVVEDLARITGGGLFALFTSHRALREVARLLRESGAEAHWPLFVHGEANRARLLTEFTERTDGILLGTASFWEGVDVPGDPLRGLVIQKLPFRVPTEPVTAARIEALEARGRDAFSGYMLPLAALRLKQGFGRLIRSRRDRGAVVLLDDRVVRARYGRYLLESLPPAPLRKGPWSDLVVELERFYAAGRRPGPTTP